MERSLLVLLQLCTVFEQCAQDLGFRAPATQCSRVSGRQRAVEHGISICLVVATGKVCV